jgi:hypothetical protein
MIHLLASFAFLVVTLGATALIAAMLIQEQSKIRVALGFRAVPVRALPHHRVRVRVAGRWQSSTATSRPQRAAA